MAILITIMVLELKVPHETNLAALLELWPVLLSYVLSFLYIGIYWNNHHHMFQLAPKVNGAVMWGNMHLMFWLSLLPFATAWTGENYAEMLPTMVYGGVLLMCAVAYAILQGLIIRLQGDTSGLAKAVGRDWKGKASPVLYLAGMGLAYVNPWLGIGMYALVAGMWLVPDRRIARTV